LQDFGVELDAALAGVTGDGPAESAGFEAFCRDPCAGSVKVEKLDAVPASIGEDEEGVAGGGDLEFVGGEAGTKLARETHFDEADGGAGEATGLSGA
jgi:hypothetical protein